MAFGAFALIRIDAVWMATEPLDMRAGPETALARVVQVFGAAHPLKWTQKSGQI
jgi:transposase